jgi:hypothetical protein
MALIFGQDDTSIEKDSRFNSELAVALGFNLAAWLVVGVIAVVIIV